MRYSLIFILIIAALSSCGHPQRFNTEEELVNFIQENSPFNNTKIVNGYEFQLEYRPSDLLVAQHLNGRATNDSIIAALRKQYNKQLYFNLSISKHQKELLSVVPNSMQEFSRLNQTLSFGMSNKVHLYSKQKDTIELLDYNYPRLYGMSRATSMMFVFPNDFDALKDDYINFSIEDLGIQTGEIRFKIPTSLIKNQPTLVFN